MIEYENAFEDIISVYGIENYLSSDICAVINVYDGDDKYCKFVFHTGTKRLHILKDDDDIRYTVHCYRERQ